MKPFRVRHLLALFLTWTHMTFFGPNAREQVDLLLNSLGDARAKEAKVVWGLSPSTGCLGHDVSITVYFRTEDPQGAGALDRIWLDDVR